MIGLGRALTVESATPGAITDVRRAWEVAPASSTDSGAPSPVLFASFAFRSPARSVAFVPALTLIDEAGARWAITAGIGDAPDPLAAVDAAVAEARPAPRVPDSLTYGHGSMSRGQWRDSVRAMAQRLREGAADKAVMARDMTVRCAHGFDERFLLERLSDLYPSTWRFCVDSLVGASPEMLIAASGGTASSRVLAGTCKPGEGEMLASSAKDLREHDLASESVSSILTQLCSSVTAQGPFLLSLPNVVHLATDVHARLGSAHLLDLVAALHPTAAVCGTPRDAAMRLIEELEDTERGSRRARACAFSLVPASCRTPTRTPSWPRPKRRCARCWTRSASERRVDTHRPAAPDRDSGPRQRAAQKSLGTEVTRHARTRSAPHAAHAAHWIRTDTSLVCPSRTIVMETVSPAL